MSLQRHSIIFGRSWQPGQVTEDCKKANVSPIFKKDKEDSGKYRLVSLTLIPGNVVEQIVLDTILKHRKDKKLLGAVSMYLQRGNHA